VFGWSAPSTRSESAATCSNSGVARSSLDRHARRQTSREQLADAYDNEHLIVCATCHIVYLKAGPHTLLQQYCPRCDGTIVDWTDRQATVPTNRRLNEIRHRLVRADAASTCRE
jgi:hypothetical protein